MIDAQRIADAINQLGRGYEVRLTLAEGTSIHICNDGGFEFYRYAPGRLCSSESARIRLTSAFDNGQYIEMRGESVHIMFDPTLVVMLETRPISYPEPGCGL